MVRNGHQLHLLEEALVPFVADPEVAKHYAELFALKSAFLKEHATALDRKVSEEIKDAKEGAYGFALYAKDFGNTEGALLAIENIA